MFVEQFIKYIGFRVSFLDQNYYIKQLNCIVVVVFVVVSGVQGYYVLEKRYDGKKIKYKVQYF